MEEFFIGQIFEIEYPPEAAEWCNKRGDCYIDEIDSAPAEVEVEEQDENGDIITHTETQIVRRFEIKEIYKPTEEELIKQRKEQFAKEFFLTSLGYIRRKVNMATGEIKDFLSDLLPTISMGIQTGQAVPIITYKEPDFTEEFSMDYMESLQEVKNVTSEFVQECFLQLSSDFTAKPLIVKE